MQSPNVGKGNGIQKIRARMRVKFPVNSSNARWRDRSGAVVHLIAGAREAKLYAGRTVCAREKEMRILTMLRSVLRRFITICILATGLGLTFGCDNRPTPVEPERIYHSFDEAFRNPTDVKHIEIFDTNLSSIPSRISELVNLEILWLYFHKLDSLPAQLALLKKLRVLGLGYNKFKEIPAVVFQIEQLDDLSFDMNRLTRIPPEIQRLKKLSGFDASDNSITSVPRELFDMPSLALVYLDRNPIQRLPDSLPLSCGIEELHLSGTAMDGVEQLRVRKMLPNTKIFF